MQSRASPNCHRIDMAFCKIIYCLFIKDTVLTTFFMYLVVKKNNNSSNYKCYIHYLKYRHDSVKKTMSQLFPVVRIWDHFSFNREPGSLQLSVEHFAIPPSSYNARAAITLVLTRMQFL